MSFDLAVWYEPAPIVVSQAVSKADALWGDITSGFTPHANVREFYESLMERYPANESRPIEWVEEHGVWSVTPSASDKAIIMSIIWPRADEVHEAVRQLAAVHDLLLFDPQDSTIVLPPRIRDAARVKIYTLDGSMAYEPGLSTIRTMLGSLSERNWGIILARADRSWYVQAALPRPNHLWLLEYCEGGPDFHYGTEVPTSDGFAEVFDAFARGDMSWRDQYVWERVEYD